MKRHMVFGAAMLIAMGAPAFAWSVQETGGRMVVEHQDDALTVQLGCRGSENDRLGIRITGLNGAGIGTLVVLVQQGDGTVNEVSVAPQGSATTVEGRLQAPTRFLDAWASGTRMQFVADGVLVLDTHLDGTAVARSRIAAVCGF